VRDASGAAVAFASLIPGGATTLAAPAGTLRLVSNSRARSWASISVSLDAATESEVVLPADI
jgi:hypothetical protein